jgi:hypothetical protein
MIKLLRIPTREITTRGAHIRHKGYRQGKSHQQSGKPYLLAYGQEPATPALSSPQLKGFTVSQQMVKL